MEEQAEQEKKVEAEQADVSDRRKDLVMDGACIVEPPVYIPPYDISDKINEADYFLGLLRVTTDKNHFRWLTSACISACRSGFDWLANRLRIGTSYMDDEDAERWKTGQEVKTELDGYFTFKPNKKGDRVQTTLKDDPRLTGLNELRNRNVHHDYIRMHPVPPRGGEALTSPGDIFMFCRRPVLGVDVNDEWDETFGCILTHRVAPRLAGVIDLLRDLNDRANERHEFDPDEEA